MPKFPYQKLRLLYIMKILQEESDEQHTITLNEIAERLKLYGISFDRKSLYADVETLRQFGMEIILTKGNRFGYFWSNRPFELPELKLLVDAVQSSHFMTAKKSAQLIDKLESLASIHEARKLRRQVFIAGRIKAPNESAYYTIDKLYEAIAADRQVSFKYYEYTLSKTMRFRRNGHIYIISPYALHWDGDNYYLIAHNPERGITHFRVDKIAGIELIDEARFPQDKKLDLVSYVQHAFSMFGGGEETVKIQFANELIGVVLDRFGKDIIIRKVDEQHFAVEVQAQVSQTFFSWIFQFSGKVLILEPETVVDRMRSMVEELAGLYN